MKIRITKGRGWYTDKVGEVYTITGRIDEDDTHGYYVDGCSQWVRDGYYEIITEDDDRIAQLERQVAGVTETLAHVGRKLAAYDRAINGTAEVGEAATLMDVIERVNQLRSDDEWIHKRINTLETQLRVAREDIVLIEDGVRSDIDRLERAVGNGRYAKSTGAGVRFDAELERVPEETPKPLLTRELVIERAKRDVAELTERIVSGRFFACGDMTVNFIVNRTKRTVVALIGWAYVPGVRERGKSRCAPDDVFNVHIGKAIALRRALGIDVPEEYVKAPQPTEIKAGDIVRGQLSGDLYRVKGRNPNGMYNLYDITRGFDGAQSRLIDIVDDSGADVAEVFT